MSISHFAVAAVAVLAWASLADPQPATRDKPLVLVTRAPQTVTIYINTISGIDMKTLEVGNVAKTAKDPNGLVFRR